MNEDNQSIPESSRSDLDFSSYCKDLISLTDKLCSKSGSSGDIPSILHQMKSTIARLENRCTTERGGNLDPVQPPSPLMRNISQSTYLSSDEGNEIRPRLLGILASAGLLEGFHQRAQGKSIASLYPSCNWPDIPSILGAVPPILITPSGIFCAYVLDLQILHLPRITSQTHAEKLVVDLNSLGARITPKGGWIVDASSLQSMPISLQAAFLGFQARFTQASASIRFLWISEKLVRSYIQQQFIIAFRLEKAGVFYFSSERGKLLSGAPLV